VTFLFTTDTIELLLDEKRKIPACFCNAHHRLNCRCWPKTERPHWLLGKHRMTTLQIELSDTTALAARAAGLLTPQALDRLLTQALRRREAADSLLAVAGRVAAADIAPMSMQEINAEVKAARADRSRGAKH
jgi:hypothetical protein